MVAGLRQKEKYLWNEGVDDRNGEARGRQNGSHRMGTSNRMRRITREGAVYDAHCHSSLPPYLALLLCACLIFFFFQDFLRTLELTSIILTTTINLAN